MLNISKRTKASKKNAEDKFLRQLHQKAQIENFYKMGAQTRGVWGAEPPIRRPQRPKDSLTDDDIEVDLRAKLAPYMLNNHEVNLAIRDFKNAGTLRTLDDFFDLFKSKYLVGVQRLSNIGLQALYASFVNKLIV